MGGSQSSRRISIDNDDPGNVIKVSESVVKRLKRSSSEPSVPKVATRSIDAKTVKDSVKSEEEEDGIPPGLLTSHQLRKQVEKELEENNKYWEDRFKKVQETNDKMSNIIQLEYARAYKEIESNFPRLPPENAKLPCQDKKCYVVECCKKNLNQPLLCAKEVRDFASCITKTRIKLQKENKLA